jgi:hypothetical protein
VLKVDQVMNCLLLALYRGILILFRSPALYKPTAVYRMNLSTSQKNVSIFDAV